MGTKEVGLSDNIKAGEQQSGWATHALFTSINETVVHNIITHA
jgi:hypothetical protein